MTCLQMQLYKKLINAVYNPSEFFSACFKIFNHPDLLFQQKEKNVNVDWTMALFDNYKENLTENSIKMTIFFCILQERVSVGDRLLLFSHSLDTLDIIEKLLHLTFEV